MSAWQPSPPPQLPRDAHKGQAGRVLCVCGSALMPGAAILCVRAAQRAGAGLVTLACRDRALLTCVPPASPETVLADLTVSLGSSGSLGTSGASGFSGASGTPGAPDVSGAAGTPGSPGVAGARAALVAVLAERQPHALVAGCGLGADALSRELVAACLEFPVPLVLDADALSVLPGGLAGLRARAAPVVLTPHPGEAARLLGRELPRDADGRLAAARQLAALSGAIVVLKGAGSIVCQGERAWVNDSGNPGMATAGSGDVLAGILGAYLAQAGGLGASWDPFEATAAAVRVHGRAGDLAAQRLGARALIASDLIEALAAAQRAP